MFYYEDLGRRIKKLRKYHCGYSQRYLAHLVRTDYETIRMIENGIMPNPPAQLILRIAQELDSFYLHFVRKSKEIQFLNSCVWEVESEEDKNYLIDMCFHITSILTMNKRGVD